MLTPQQQTALKAHIDASPDLSVFPNNADGNFAIADLLNLDAAPDWWVWRTRLEKHTVTDETSPEATTFSWPALGARSASEQFIWRELWNSTLSCNPSLPQVRQGFADVFSGGTGATMRTHMLAMARRKATRVEKVLSSGTGTAAAPATLTFEGQISYQDVEEARR